jgi:hypothetical protein
MPARMAATKKRREPVVDDAAVARVDTELRNALSGRDPEFASAVLARVVGTRASLERKSSDEWFGLAARALLDEAAIRERIAQADDAARVALALLATTPWWTRTALVQAIALVRSGGTTDEDAEAKIGRILADVLLRWPVLVRTNAFTRSEELSLFEPLAVRIRSHVEGVLSIGRASSEQRSAVGLGRTLLSLALFPALVAQRRPRVTRSGDLHGADATKLERALGEARGLFATWERLGAFEEMDGALSPIAARVRRLLDDPGGLVRELLEQRLGEVGFALAELAAAAEPGDVLELGSALLAVGLEHKFAFGFDVPSLAARVERNDFHFAPLLFVDVERDALSIPPDVRAAIRGEPLVTGPSAAGFVQPNYEAVLPPGVPLGAAFVVACAAELQHFEAVARLKLTRDSVLAARSVGIDVSEIVAALEQISAPRPLPPAVKHAVEEWGESVGEARIRTAVLFDVRAAEPLLSKVAEKLAPLTLDRPSPNLFVLSRAPNPRELAHLRALGVVTRTVAAAHSKHEPESDHEAKGDASYTFHDRKRSPRDLRADLEPRRVMLLVEASRPIKKGGAPASGPTSSALDPDDHAERPLAPAIDEALEERRREWAQRPDWLAELRRLLVSPTFRRAAATTPGGVALAIRRTSDPHRLALDLARIVAESSVRRVAD